jgi:death-on-curing protein
MTEISVQFRYFDLDHAIATHSYVIEKSGGLCGVKNQGAIESIIAHVQNDDYYPDLIDKMTYLVYGINKNHAFNDGNKRASIALSSFFLGLNEHDFAIPQYTRGMEEVAVWLACSLVDDVCLKRIIRFLLYDDEFRIFNFIMECKK